MFCYSIQKICTHWHICKNTKLNIEYKLEWRHGRKKALIQKQFISLLQPHIEDFFEKQNKMNLPATNVQIFHI